MKIVPHDWFAHIYTLMAITWLTGGLAGLSTAQDALPKPSKGSTVLQSNSDLTYRRSGAERQAAATRLVSRVIEQLALGDAFDSKVRQRVWVGGREVIGVGTYEQAGEGSGRFNLQVAMHDGDGKHTLQQISDGRLAWTREQIGEKIQLQRVDVGRLDQWVHGSSLSIVESGENNHPSVVDLPPSLRVGGFTEMLENLITDYDLRVVAGQLESRDVWIVRGSLKQNVRRSWLEQFGSKELPELCPSEVVVAIAKTDAIETRFGQWIPIRFEFWTDPGTVEPTSTTTNTETNIQAQNAQDLTLASQSLGSPVVDHRTNNGQSTTSGLTAKASASNSTNRRLVSLIELYSIRPISAPPIARFRFDNQDMEVNFTNDTDRYLSRYGIQITERQSRMLRR